MRRAMISQLLLLLPIYSLLLSLSIFLKPPVVDAYIAKPGCNDTCGSVKIPFPFGIGPNCFHNPWFEIECNEYHKKPMLSKLQIEVMEVKLDLFTVKVGLPLWNTYNADAYNIDWRGSPYEISTSYNVFVMKRCPGEVVLLNESNAIMAGCATVCGNTIYNKYALHGTNNCFGDHCCQASLIYNDSPRQFYHIEFGNQSSSPGGQSCLVAALIESESMSQYYAGGLQRGSVGPVVLRFSFQGKLPHDRSVGSFCDETDDPSTQPSGCNCQYGYYGNPYVPNGCQAARECKDCHGLCDGNWDIEGNLLEPGSFYCEKKPILTLSAILGEYNCIMLNTFPD